MPDELAIPDASLGQTTQPAQKISFIADGTGERAYWSFVLASLHGLNAIARRERYATLLVASVGAAIVGTVFGFFVASKNPEYSRFSVLAGVLIALPCLMTGVNGGPWTKWRRSVLSAINGQGPRETQSVAISVSPEGYTADFADSSRTIRWSGIAKITRLDRWILICHADGGDADAVPLSAFPSDADADAWLATASELLDASGHGPSVRVRAAIDRGPVCCGKCGYDLVGVRKATCPECGFELSQIQIELWRTLQMPFRRQMLSVWGFRG